LITETELVAALNHRADDPATKQLHERYIEQGQKEEELVALNYPDSPQTQNRIRLEVAFRLARVYAQVPSYREEAILALNDVRLAAINQEATLDLVKAADDILDTLFS
jgi:hypothetical protein